MSGDYETHDDRQPDITYIKEKTMSCNLRELTVTSLLEQAQGEISKAKTNVEICLLYTSPSPRDLVISRMPSSA